jgi:glutamate-1-semialdehyde aminotransferase
MSESDADAAALIDALTPRYDFIDLDRLRRLVEEERKRYVERTPMCRELAERARRHMIGGVMCNWHTDWHLPHPLYVQRAKGDRVWDADGNEYVDFNLGDTPDIFGHAPDNPVMRSLSDFIRNQDIAVVVTEPALTNTGIVMPRPRFHEGLRELCSRYGSYLLIDETHTLSEGPRGCTGAWGLEPDIWVAGKCIASGVPCAVYGFSQEIGRELGAVLALDDPHVAAGFTGLGNTMTGNALSTHALRMTLEHVLTDEVYQRMRTAMARLVDGMRGVIAKREVPFSVTTMGNRCDLRFLPEPPMDPFEALPGLGLGGYFEFLHLRAINSGFLMIPYYNMFLCSPVTAPEDVDRWTECFDDIIADMLGRS